MGGKRAARLRLVAGATFVLLLGIAWLAFDPVGADCGDSSAGWICNGRAEALLDLGTASVVGLVLVLIWEVAARLRALRSRLRSR